MHGTAPVLHKEIEVKLELAPASLALLKRFRSFNESTQGPRAHRSRSQSILIPTSRSCARKG
jgi:hypothetical protein